MRIAVSAIVFLVALLVGAKTQWVAMSDTAVTIAEDRAHAAAVLGQTGPGATSAELIDAAVVRGEISPEYGLLYGVYLACDSDRLPAEYRGKEEAQPEPKILWEADVDWATLSPEVRQRLTAFFASHLDGGSGQPCGAQIRRLADGQPVWWADALRAGPFAPRELVSTANRP